MTNAIEFFLFLICGNLRCFIAFPYKLFNGADVIIIHSVEETGLFGQPSTDPKRLCDWLVSENSEYFFIELCDICVADYFKFAFKSTCLL